MKKGALFTLALLFCLVLPVAANAFDPFGSPCTASGGGGSSAVCTDDNSQGANGSDPLQDKIADATQLVAFVGGAAAVIILIVSAIRFITSGGNPEKATAARNGIIYAAVGLVVIALAQSIIVFVVHRI